MKRYLLAFGLVAASTITATSFAGEKNKTASAHEIAPQVTLTEFETLVKEKKVVVLDANGKTMYEEGHVPGAISFAAHEGKLGAVLPQDKKATIVAYCGGPMCTAWEAAAKEAQQLGYTNIKHFKGGIKGWKEAKLPVETGAAKSI